MVFDILSLTLLLNYEEKNDILPRHFILIYSLQIRAICYSFSIVIHLTQQNVFGCYIPLKYQLKTCNLTGR